MSPLHADNSQTTPEEKLSSLIQWSHMHSRLNSHFFSSFFILLYSLLLLTRQTGCKINNSAVSVIRIINDWNGLPYDSVNVHSTNLFKTHLDRFYYDYQYDIV